jgi:hypothetical protein
MDPNEVDTVTIPASFVGRGWDYPRPMPIAAVVWLVVVLAGSFVVGFLMLRRQQRIYREGDGPPDLYRADDLEAGEPFDPKAGPRAAEDFFAAGARAQWLRGARDESFSPHHPHTGASSLSSPEATGGLWAINDHEGWCADPFGRHESRWISSGVPTSLVRDGQIESQDDPPDPQTAG